MTRYRGILPLAPSHSPYTRLRSCPDAQAPRVGLDRLFRGSLRLTRRTPPSPTPRCAGRSARSVLGFGAGSSLPKTGIAQRGDLIGREAEPVLEGRAPRRRD